ncbi:MAG: ssDNA-specific exonuclease RecJ [Candidatus Alkanophagales archaeon MCA70_species_1]|nr:ssDNA-specific exonuclease RecJ [Candidatus Alkanophaga volatiphilum]
MRCLIVHHWDADGVSSAALLRILLGRGVFGEPPVEVTNVTPEIGVYSLEGLRRRIRGGYDLVILADICFSRGEVLRLKELAGAERLWIFDHHHQEEVRGAGVVHVNPVIGGGWCPSASWLLAERFRTPSPRCEFLKVLGAVGDLEGRIRETEAYRDVERFLGGVGMSFEELLHAAELVDSNYRVGCVECVEEAVLKLLEVEKPQDVLEVAEWRGRAERVRAEIEKWVSGCGRRSRELTTAGGRSVLICEMDTRLHIISAVTRRLAAANPKKIVVVVNRGFERGRGRQPEAEAEPEPEAEVEAERERRVRGGFLQIYVRTHLGVDLTPLIPYMRGRGCSAGGKREVVGVVAPPGAAALEGLEAFLARNF